MNYELEKEVDFSLGLNSGVRFRVNAYFQRGLMAASLRSIPSSVPSPEQMMILKRCCASLTNLTAWFWLWDLRAVANRPP